MNVTNPDEGLLWTLWNTVSYQGLPTKTTILSLGLYANNVAIVDSTVFADLTECSFSGYNRQFLIKTTGDPVMTAPGGTAEFNFESYPFTNSGGSPTTVFGWFVLNPGTGGAYDLLLGGALFSPPVVLLPAQELAISLQARLTARF